MAGSYYQLAIHHPGLNKHRFIRGNDRFHVESAAAAQRRARTEQYARKEEMDERRKERDDKRRELGDNLIEADERTMEVQTALAELPMDERNAACAIELRRQKKLTLADSILALPPVKSLLVRCGTRSLILPPK